MRKQIFFSGASYFFVGIFSLMLAVFVTSMVMRNTRAQDLGRYKSKNTYLLAQADAEAVPATQAPAADPIINLTDSINFLEPYIFDTREGRRNPFRPPILVESGEKFNPGTPLERYEVDEIRLVGILWDTRIPKAMFIDPTGAVHVIGKDDRIGRRQGYIATIRESEVVIVETTNFNGELAYATKILRIDKK